MPEEKGSPRAGDMAGVAGRGKAIWCSEPELHSGLEAEVALAVVAAGEVVAKAGQHIICIHDPDRDLLGHREVAANLEGKALLLGDFEAQRPLILLHALA